MSKKRKHTVNPDLAKMLDRKRLAVKKNDKIQYVEQHRLSKILHLVTGLKPDIFYDEVKRVVAEGETHFQELLDAVKDAPNPNKALQTMILDKVYPNHLPVTELPPLAEHELKPIGWKPPKPQNWGKVDTRAAIAAFAAIGLGIR